MEKKNFFHKYYIPIIAFLVAFVPRMILNLYATPLRTISDEFNTLSIMAWICGKDWSEIVSNGGYYGFGYTALFSPLFLLIKNPIVLYRTILVVQSLIHASIALIAYKLLTKYFHVTNEKFLFFASVTSSYMVVTRTMLVFNEHGLIISSWLIAWLLLRLVNEESKTRDSILLMLLMAYTLTMHTRSWIYWMGFACTFVFYALVQKKCLVSLVPSAITAAVSILVSQYLVKYVQNVLWYVESGETIRNSALKINKFDLFMDVNSWQAWLNTIMGLFNSFAVISGGLLIMGFVLLIYYVYRMGEKLIVKKCQHAVEWDKMILIFYFTIMVVGTIFAISIRWLPQTMEGMMDGVGTTAYGLKAVTYVRYAAPFCGPILLVIMAMMEQQQKEFLRLYKYVAFSVFGLQLYWTCCVLPYLFKNNQAIEIYLPFSFQKRNSIVMGRMVFMPAGVLLCLLVVLFWVLLAGKKHTVIVGCMAILMMYQYFYNCVAYDLDTEDINARKINASYAAMKDIANEKTLGTKELYVVDYVAKGNHQSFYLYQFYFKDMRVHIGYPTEGISEAIMFTNGLIIDEEVNLAGYMCAQLDDNEFIWVKGDRLQEIFLNHGVQLR